MGLDVVDVGGVHGGVCVGAAQHVTLAFDGGRDQVATALAVVADGGSADDRPDAVAVGESGRQRLEDDGSNAVAADEAVARGVGELAAAVGGEHAGARVDDALFRQEYEIDPAGDRQGALTEPDRLDGVVDGHERGGAGGVDGEAGPPQVECVGQTAGGDGAGGRTGHGVQVELIAVVVLQMPVVPAELANEDARVGAGDAGQGLTRVFEGFVGDLQEEPLLGVHAIGLPGEIPKNSASNASMSWSKPPHRLTVRPGVRGVGS